MCRSGESVGKDVGSIVLSRDVVQRDGAALKVLASDMVLDVDVLRAAVAVWVLDQLLCDTTLLR